MRVVLGMPKNLRVSLITLLWSQAKNNRFQGNNLFKIQILFALKKVAKVKKKIQNPQR